MKYLNRTWLSAVALLALASCADDNRLDFDVEKPQSIVELEYLKDYDVLKSYVDRTANPNFKLGAGVSVADFNKKEVDYSMIASNFDEMTAGWEMKHGGVVQADGSLSLGNVKTFIEAASSGGITVFGHTLCWHSNQKAGYLNKLIEPVVIPGTVTVGSGGYCMVLKNATAQSDNWKAQTWYKFPTPFTQGVKYTFTCKIKATEAYSESMFLQSSTPNGPQAYPGGFNITTEWTDVTLSFTPDNAIMDKLTFNFGDFAGKIYVDDVKLTADGSNVNLLPNSDFETKPVPNITGWSGWTFGVYEEISANGEGYSVGGPSSGGYNLNLKNSTAQSDNWKAQAWYLFSTPLTQGTKYTFTCMIKGTSDYNESIFLQSSTSQTQGYPGGFPVTTEWKEVSLTFTPSDGTIDKFTFNFGNFVGTISIDNVKLTADGSSTNLIPNGDFEATPANINGWTSWSGYQSLSADGDGYVAGGGDQIIEKTPEEKKTIITAELERWIAGMLEATKDKVKAWDVVNEPMSDWPDQTKLKTGVGKTDMAADEFYWQDYLGKDYAVKAIEFARKYGNSNDILFINDYGIEGADQKKCLGLIEYIKYVDSQGVKVDGIGTQMHVTCGQTSMEGIRAMFTNLAATGKLIKVSELDMGYRVAGASENLKTEEITNEQHKEMAAFYKQIVAAYFELIPAAQRYGITVWSPLDSPAESSWRGGEPIGLWDRNYNRKHAYGSFADALKQ